LLSVEGYRFKSTFFFGFKIDYFLKCVHPLRIPFFFLRLISLISKFLYSIRVLYLHIPFMPYWSNIRSLFELSCSLLIAFFKWFQQGWLKCIQVKLAEESYWLWLKRRDFLLRLLLPDCIEEHYPLLSVLAAMRTCFLYV
jgi:hypothetical protein